MSCDGIKRSKQSLLISCFSGDDPYLLRNSPTARRFFRFVRFGEIEIARIAFALYGVLMGTSAPKAERVEVVSMPLWVIRS